MKETTKTITVNIISMMNENNNDLDGVFFLLMYISDNDSLFDTIYILPFSNIREHDSTFKISFVLLVVAFPAHS